MTGMTQEEYASMMLGGGRSPEGNRSLPNAGRGAVMARIIAGVDHLARAGHRRGHRPRQDREPYWQPVFAGLRVLQALDRRATSPTS